MRWKNEMEEKEGATTTSASSASSEAEAHQQQQQQQQQKERKGFHHRSAAAACDDGDDGEGEGEGEGGRRSTTRLRSKEEEEAVERKEKENSCAAAVATPSPGLLLPRVAVNSVDVGDEADHERLHLRRSPPPALSSSPLPSSALANARPASTTSSSSSPDSFVWRRKQISTSPSAETDKAGVAEGGAANLKEQEEVEEEPPSSWAHAHPLSSSQDGEHHPYFESMALTPSCAQDFTQEWVLFIMQQYFEQNFGCTISRIGGFHAEKAGSMGESTKGGSGRRTSQHLLSQAYKVMVDVPDPPVKLPPVRRSLSKEDRQEVEEDDEEGGGGSGGGGGAGDNNNVKTPPGAGSPLHSKTHHLFVKIPPQRTAKFERMVRRNRTLEHEVKVGGQQAI